jgi:putative ABC transport system permease protein
MWRFALQNLITRPVRTRLAIVGLTIPIVAILGLFSLTHGIRSLMGNTLASMKGLIVMQAGTPAPVFSELPSGLVEKIRAVPGVGMVAPEVWRIAPPLEGRGLLARAAEAMASKGRSPLQGFAETIMIEGEQLPEHLRIRSGAYKNGLLPPSKGGAVTSTNPTWASPTSSSAPRSRAITPTPTVPPRRWATRSASPAAPSGSSGSTRPAR